MENKTLLVIAIIVLIASAIGFFMVFGLNKNILLAPVTGEEGNVTIDIIQNTRIDTTFFLINFSRGFINPGSGTLTLDSNGTGLPITNWLDEASNPITLLDRGFVIENIGNIDLTLGVQLQDTVDFWLPFGPSSVSATLEYKLSNCDTTLPALTNGSDCTYTTQFDPGPAGDDIDAACSTFNVGTIADIYETISTTLDATCDVFEFENAKDEVRLDLELVLPEDIAPTVGASFNKVILDIAAA